MLHPSYTDLMEIVNSEVEVGEQPLVQSRYSIVMATAKRARQIISGEKRNTEKIGKKPLSRAVEELYGGNVKIISEEEAEEIVKLNEERAAINAVTAARIAEREAARKAEEEAEEAARKAEEAEREALEEDELNFDELEDDELDEEENEPDLAEEEELEDENREEE